MIRKDGYYISEGFPWTDWQAGHKFEGTNYRMLFFSNDNKVLMYTSDSLDYNIDEIRFMEYNDIYELYDNIVEVIIDPESKWKVKNEYTILSPELLLDGNMKEYKFIPFGK